MTTIRDQVLHEIATVISAAQNAGKGDGLAVARSTFPGTPDNVLYEAWAKVDGDMTAAWWDAVERTIDGDVIARAVEIAGGANAPGK